MVLVSVSFYLYLIKIYIFVGRLFDQRELLIGPSVSLSLRTVLTDERTDISFDQMELLIGPSLTVSLPSCLTVSVFNGWTDGHIVLPKLVDNWVKR